jgi:hypothetical protein
MIILPAEDVNMKGGSGGHGKGVEDVREHLGAQISNLLTFHTEIGETVGS